MSERRAAARSDFRSGSVIRYPYLWERQGRRGETEGRKPRPVAVAVKLETSDGVSLLLWAITSSPPEPGRWAVEIPPAEKKRGGLDIDKRLWIVLDECNHDKLYGSYYVDPGAVLGRFSAPFFAPMVRAFIERRRSVSFVDRR